MILDLLAIGYGMWMIRSSREGWSVGVPAATLERAVRASDKTRRRDSRQADVRAVSSSAVALFERPPK